MSKITRRKLLQTGMAAGTTLAAIACSPKSNTSKGPTLITNNIKDITLRFVGTGAAQNNDIRNQAEKDLGFKLQMRALSTAEVIQKGI